MQRALLKKVTSTHTNLRTDEIDGVFLDAPQVGKRFQFFSRSLDPEKDYRLVSTSEVVEVDDFCHVIWVTTQNSEYKLVILDNDLVRR